MSEGRRDFASGYLEGGIRYGFLCLSWRDVRLQFRGRALGACGYAGKQGGFGRGSCGDNYGLCTDEKYYAVWHVFFSGKSPGGGGDCRGDGRFDADALYSCDSRSMGAGIACGSCVK